MPSTETTSFCLELKHLIEGTSTESAKENVKTPLIKEIKAIAHALKLQ